MGHIYDATVNGRCQGRNCSICSGKKVLIGFNDLQTTHPEIAAEADGWDPLLVTAGSGKKSSWICEVGHRWKARVSSRTHGTGCAVCSGRKVLAGFNDLATLNPELAAEADGWDPKTVTAGSGLKKKWKCTNGHRWEAVIGSRTQGRGCPSCSTSGFDPTIDAWLYFMRHDQWGLFQIGITNNPDQRLSSHGKSGWEIIELRGPMPGDIARGWEQGILHALSRRDVRLSPEHIAGKFDGYTEAWIQEDFPADSLAALMNLVHEDES